ncbi:MAG: hypothetical protein RTU92_09735 [Candidatus Thorarchaeota archaeon]
MEQDAGWSVNNMPQMPWSYYSTIVTFGFFFASLNIFILTALLSHPMQGPIWLVLTIVGAVGLVGSIWMVRVHQNELIAKKAMRDKEQD